jgi:hypothetical protein
VVSTAVAGIPELVVDGQTGILVSPGDVAALTQALEQLLRDGELRLRYGQAGRARIERHFRIQQTVAPLLRLLEDASRKYRSAVAELYRSTALSKVTDVTPRIGYLIDRWPDQDLPLLEQELEQMNRRNVPIIPIVCELDSAAPLNRALEQMTSSLEFLPDAMVIEAEWRGNPVLAQKLEEERAQRENRPPSAIFLRQARFALVLRTLLSRKNISHIHATSSRALVCALLLKQLLEVTVSATIEPQPKLSQAWIRDALSKCVGGRVSDRRIRADLDGRFLAEPKPRRWRGPFAPGRTRIRQRFFRQWRNQLETWSR